MTPPISPTDLLQAYNQLTAAKQAALSPENLAIMEVMIKILNSRQERVENPAFSAIASLETKLENAKITINSKSEENKKLNKKVEKLKEKIVDYEVKIKTTESEKKQLEKTVENLKKEVAGLEDSLEEKDKDIKIHKDSVEQRMKAVEQRINEKLKNLIKK